MPKITVHSCPDCKRHLRDKHLIATKHYDDKEGSMFIYQCVCGTFTGVFRYDDESKNTDYKTLRLK